VSASLAPISTPPTAAPMTIPRFASGTELPAFSIIECRSRLLFPFVTSQNGFDTTLVISNTTLDPFSTSPQDGDCRLQFYGRIGANGPAPATQTSTVMGAGQQLICGLEPGGNPGVQPTPGFQGYVIASCAFPFAH